MKTFEIVYYDKTHHLQGLGYWHINAVNKKEAFSIAKKEFIGTPFEIFFINEHVFNFYMAGDII